MQRRTLLTYGTAALLLAGCSSMSKKQQAATDKLQATLARIEADAKGRLGVAVVDAGSGLEAGWRMEERFPMCSTFKLLLAANVLHRVQGGDLSLERRQYFAPSQVVAYSPVSQSRAGDGGGMSLLELCEAAIVVSDNTAANVLLELVDGPAGLTAWLRSIGDSVSRLDRYETALNEAAPGDERDTSAPLSMLHTAQNLLLGSTLDGFARALLQKWLLDSRTGDKRLRAGMPSEWKVGGKTGSGENGTANDLILVWPMTQSEPLLVSCYLTGSTLAPAERDAIHVRVGQAVTRWYYDI